VVGFAAETDRLHEHAAAKRVAKGCDWIVANDVGAHTGVMGGARNQVHILDAAGEESWPELPKEEVATRLAARIAAAFPCG
jgi:phosphopantothenoylcysteine decarboxylase/phosphopantothenate--cysteine ligase